MVSALQVLKSHGVHRQVGDSEKMLKCQPDGEQPTARLSYTFNYVPSYFIFHSWKPVSRQQFQAFWG